MPMLGSAGGFQLGLDGSYSISAGGFQPALQRWAARAARIEPLRALKREPRARMLERLRLYSRFSRRLGKLSEIVLGCTKIEFIKILSLV